MYPEYSTSEPPIAYVTVDLQGKFRGNEIIEASRNVGGDDQVEKEYYIDDQEYLVVGRKSLYPHSNVIICVSTDPDNYQMRMTPIDRSEIYQHIGVMSWDWPGERYAVGTLNEQYLNAAMNYRRQLEEELKKLKD